MTLTRRDFLRIGGLAGSALAMTGCGAVAQQAANESLPSSLATPMPSGEGDSDRIARLLKRAGYGPRPGDLDRARALGIEAYLEEQFAPESIDDGPADLLMAGLTYYQMDPGQLIEQEPPDVIQELMLATIGRALLSRRQLYEAMVEFWSDHFHIYLRENRFTTLLKISDDRDAIRPHALGSFRDLLYASASSPAMLIYLDNNQNSAEAPNENYARELMELHTLGVDGGYTEEDVRELARVLTGWSIRRRNEIQSGDQRFNPTTHDDGEKTVLGVTFPAGQGEQDVFQALDLLAAHPSTAQFIATKLVRRFVADDPPVSLVQRVAAVFRETNGDIKAMLRVIFLSDEFASAPPKLRRPYHFMLATLRGLNVQVGPRAYRPLAEGLRAMGQMPFMWPAPDGYPDVAGPWLNNLLARWNLALRLMMGEARGLRVPVDDILERARADDLEEALDAFSGLLLGRAMDDTERAAILAHTGTGPLSEANRPALLQGIGLLIASPAFQWM